MLHLSRILLASLIACCGLLAIPSTARAETFNTCAGFIDTLPATISTQGVWCLRHDLSTSITSGSAITIATNNVTIDCNDFKLGGLAAGAGTKTRGILAENRLNGRVRHCNIRGFYYGVYFSGLAGGGHVIENNRFDGNAFYSLVVTGDGSVVRHNEVNDTGGAPESGFAVGIYTNLSVDILDNAVNGVLSTADASGDASAYGIFTYQNASGRISGNAVRGVIKLGAGTATGIQNFFAGRIEMRGNHLSGDGSAGSVGIRCSNTSSVARDNTINGFSTGITTCRDGGDNIVVP